MSNKSNLKIFLKYIGNGAIPGIPARDLNNDEVALYGGQKKLLGTGLWQLYKATKRATKKQDGE